MPRVLSQQEYEAVAANLKTLADIERTKQFYNTLADLAKKGYTRQSPNDYMGFIDKDKTKKKVTAAHEAVLQLYFIDELTVEYDENDETLVVKSKADQTHVFLSLNTKTATVSVPYENFRPTKQDQYAQRAELILDAVMEGMMQNAAWFHQRNPNANVNDEYPDRALLKQNKHPFNGKVMGDSGITQTVDTICMVVAPTGRLRILAGKRSIDGDRLAVAGGIASKADGLKLLAKNELLEEVYINGVFSQEIDVDTGKLSMTSQHVMDNFGNVANITGVIDEILQQDPIFSDRQKPEKAALIRAQMQRVAKETNPLIYINNLLAGIKENETDATREAALHLHCRLYEKLCPDMYAAYNDFFMRNFEEDQEALVNQSEGRSTGNSCNKTRRLIALLQGGALAQMEKAAGLKWQDSPELTGNAFYDLTAFSNAFSDHSFYILDAIALKIESGELRYTRELHEQISQFMYELRRQLVDAKNEAIVDTEINELVDRDYLEVKLLALNDISQAFNKAAVLFNQFKFHEAPHNESKIEGSAHFTASLAGIANDDPNNISLLQDLINESKDLINHHRYPMRDAFEGRRNTETWSLCLKAARVKGLEVLQAEFAQISGLGDEARPNALQAFKTKLVMLRETYLFKEHRDTWKIAGAWGRTAAQKDIDHLLDAVRDLQKPKVTLANSL